MSMTELPQQLREEFERTAHSLHRGDGIREALIEAIELWLAQQQQKLIQAEATANNQAFENIRTDLEEKYCGKWVVIAHGKLQGVADSPEELNHLAPNARHRIVVQVGQTRPQEVELGWQMTFG